VASAGTDDDKPWNCSRSPLVSADIKLIILIEDEKEGDESL